MDLKAFPLDPSMAGREMQSVLKREMLCILDADLRIRDVSRPFEKTLGHSRAVLRSTPLADFVHRDDLVRVLLAIQQIVQQGTPTEFRCRFVHADGSYHALLWAAAPGRKRMINTW